jgi:hypothetical protein
MFEGTDFPEIVFWSEAGCKTVFSVFGRDRFQNPSSEGTLYVVTQPLNRPPADLEIVDAGNGSYLVSSS